MDKFNVGDKVRIIDKNFKNYLELEYYILWKSRNALYVWCVGREKDQLYADGYFGESQIEKV